MSTIDIAATVKAAAITIDELAYLCDVSRTTASKWVNKRSTPHVLIKEFVDYRLQQLQAACKTKTLPLSPAASVARRVVKPGKVAPDGRRQRQAAYVREELIRLMGE